MKTYERDEVKERFTSIFQLLDTNDSGGTTGQERIKLRLCEYMEYITTNSCFKKRIDALLEQAKEGLANFEDFEMLALDELGEAFQRVKTIVDENNLTSPVLTNFYRDFEFYRSGGMTTLRYFSEWTPRKSFQDMEDTLRNIIAEIGQNGGESLISPYIVYIDKTKFRIKPFETCRKALNELEIFSRTLLGVRFHAWTELESCYKNVYSGSELLVVIPEYLFNKRVRLKEYLTRVQNFLLLDSSESNYVGKSHRDMSDGEPFGDGFTIDKTGTIFNKNGDIFKVGLQGYYLIELLKKSAGSSYGREWFKERGKNWGTMKKLKSSIVKFCGEIIQTDPNGKYYWAYIENSN